MNVAEFPADTQRTRINPNLLDVLETIGARPGLAGIAPAGRILAVEWPDRILLFVIEHDFVEVQSFSHLYF